MATTVGSHSVSAFATPVNGGPLDANVVRGNDNTIRTAYVAHDADTGIHVQSSTLANRPAAGTAGRKWITADTGVYKLWYDDGTTWHEVAAGNIDVFVIAGEALVKGDVVKVTGYNNGTGAPIVAKMASASDTAFGIVNSTTIANGATGYITNTGLIQDVATNAFSVGDILYPNTSGGFTATKPTSGNYQPIAFVLRSNANNGVLYVEFSAPRIVERSDNTASTIVLRDASGNFSAGTITAGAVTSTGLVTFASLKGTGATTVTNIINDGTMATASATTLATSSSIKTYVDSQVATVDTLAEVLANGNTTGANDIIVTAGQKVTTDTIAETTSGSGVTIDSVLLKDDVVNATDIETGTVSANDGTTSATIANSTGVMTIASSVLTTTDINGGTIDGTTIGGSSAAAGTFTTVGATTGNITTVNATTVDATNVEVTNVKAKDGTASITIADSTGVATISAAPVLSALTASQAVFTDASKGLVSNAITGTGSVVMSASPTLSGTITAASLSMSGTLTLGSDVALSRGAADRLDLATGDSLNLVSGTYKIANTDVLSSTTLGANVVNSSLTSVGTLTSLTISGDLTVDTSTLKVDSTNNRVGIGTASPGQLLHMVSTGTSADLRLQNTGSTASDWILQSVSGPSISATGAAFGIYSNTASAYRLIIDGSGNLGLGVTPSAWADYKALQTTGAAFMGYSDGASNNQAIIAANAFFTTGSTWKYIYTDNASYYRQFDGQHQWFNAPSGTAGNTITFTQAMTLDASGNLGVGETSPGAKLEIKESSANTPRFRMYSAYNGGASDWGIDFYRDTDAANDQECAFIRANRTGGNVTGLVFGTGSSGTGAGERARITSGGYFKASNDGTYFSSTSSVHEFRTNTSSNEITHNTHTASSSPYGVRISYTAASPNGTDNWFLYCDDSTALRAEIRSNGGLANYSANNVNLASDERLKKDIAPIASTWDKLKAIEVVNFRYKDCNDGDPALYGVIAQQVQPIVPELVVVTREAVEAKDAVLDDDGNEVKPAVEAAPEYYGIREQPMYWLAIKALQEAQDRIEALEARLEALEA